MAMNDRISTRIDPQLKSNVEAIFAQLGLSAGEAIRMFYAQVEMNRGLPFEAKIPNAETIAALKEAQEGKGRRFGSLEEMWSYIENLPDDEDEDE